MNFNRWLLPAALILILSSCSKDQMVPASQRDATLKTMVSNAASDGSLDYWLLPKNDDFAAIPQDPKNILTDEKVALGKLLFYETAFATGADQESGLGTYSCSTCHVASAGFRAGSAQGIGDGGVGYGLHGEARVRNTAYSEIEMDVQGIRPLSLISVAFIENTLWNGSFGSRNVNIGTEDKWVGFHETNNLGLSGIESQLVEGVELHKLEYDTESVEHNGYKYLFDIAFPEVIGDERYDNVRASYALSAYIRTLFPNEAPFQKWLEGDIEAMTEEEKEGAMLFFGKAACTNCHSGPGFASVEFHAVGVNNMYQRPSFNTDETDLRNFGRGGFTGVAEDLHKFKVPQLYNMRDTEFYFHGASRTKLREVVQYFNLAEKENQEVPTELLSDYFKPLFLTDEEVDQLTLFIDQSLRDPNLERYLPSEVLSGACFPNADFQSSMDLGCN